MLIDRRRFIASASAGLLLSALPLKLGWSATPDDRRFIFVILRGAMDGLAAVVPTGDPGYEAARKELALDAASLLPLNADFALHPAFQPLLPLYHKKQLAVLHAIASPYRSRSHFDAQDVLENGGNGDARSEDDGWLGRALALLPQEKGLAISPAMPLVMHGAAGNAASWYPKRLESDEKGTFMQQVQQMYSHDRELNPYLQQALSAERTAMAAAMDKEDKMSGRGAAGAAQFPALAKACASFLMQEEGPRIAVLENGGWDTHARQGMLTGLLANHFTALADGLAALPAAMGETVWKKTTVIVATEFGRTVSANGTGGTDHGTASVAFVLGGNIRGGQVISDWPGLKGGQLYEGRDLAPTADLRSLFKTVLHTQLGIDRNTLDSRIFPDSAQAGLIGALV